MIIRRNMKFSMWGRIVLLHSIASRASMWPHLGTSNNQVMHLQCQCTQPWSYTNLLTRDGLASRWFSLSLPLHSLVFYYPYQPVGYDRTMLQYWLSSLNTLQWSRVGKGRKPSDFVHFVASRLVAKCTMWFHMATPHHRFFPRIRQLAFSVKS